MKKRKIIFMAVIIEMEGKILLICDKNKQDLVVWRLPECKIGGKKNYPEFKFVNKLARKIGIGIMMPLECNVFFEKDLGNNILKVYKTHRYNGGFSVIVDGRDEVGGLKLELFSMVEVRDMISKNKILPKHAEALAFGA